MPDPGRPEAKIDAVLGELGRHLGSAPSSGYFARHRGRYQRNLEAIARQFRAGDILEIGALPCHLTYCLAELGYSVVGVDLAPDRLAPFIADHRLRIERCDIEQERLPFADGRFSLVIFTEVLEHLRIEPIHALGEIHRVLADDGILFCTTPNLYSVRNILSFVRGRGLGHPYEEFAKLRSSGHMGHIREYSADEVREFLERTGFRVVEARHEVYRKSDLGPLVDLAYRMMPGVRPYLSFISTKARKDARPE